jgi:outer membrane PBP1 activator LpoA protein
VPLLRANSATTLTQISGMTGKLHIDEHNRVRRDLDWAQIKSGVPFVL